jgi:hypothetical protein
MIRDAKVWKAFERKSARRLEKEMTHEKALLLFEAMWRHAKALGRLKRLDALEGLETDIEVARTLNSLKTPTHV